MTTKTKFELYILHGCATCARIKYALESEDIIYEEIDCTSSENKKCDTLEDKIDCGRYPMAVIKKNGSTTIIHTCKDRKPSLGATKKIPVDSEDMFIQEVKKAYIY
jgi:glutaredoxin